MTAPGLGNSAFPPSVTFSLSSAWSRLPLGLSSAQPSSGTEVPSASASALPSAFFTKDSAGVNHFVHLCSRLQQASHNEEREQEGKGGYVHRFSQGHFLSFMSHQWAGGAFNGALGEHLMERSVTSRTHTSRRERSLVGLLPLLFESSASYFFSASAFIASSASYFFSASAFIDSASASYFFSARHLLSRPRHIFPLGLPGRPRPRMPPSVIYVPSMGWSI